jgi:acyl carrier protein
MNAIERTKLRSFIVNLLVNKRDFGSLSDLEFLFSSGRLDSLAATEVVLFLEREFAIDFSQTHFDINRIDTVESIISLVGEGSAYS